MNTDVKAQWTHALRSGEYRQTRGALHRSNNSYCALGVLCDLAYKAGAVQRHDPPMFSNILSGIHEHCYSYGRSYADSTLPNEVVRWAGVQKTALIASLNDSGLPFDQIADVIERDLCETTS